ncbi:unnamed protein product [Urochloa humidicola]
MASDHGGGGCNKRYRQASSCADDDVGEMSGSNKRCGVAPSSGANDDGPGADTDSCSDTCGGHGQETMDGDGSTGEDNMFESDSYDDDDEAEKDASACEEEEQRYVVLTQDDIRARQEADTAKVAEVLSIPTGFAALLLRHFKWRVGLVQEDWFSDDRRVRHAVGLLADGGLVPTARSPWPQMCTICFDEYPAGRMRSAGCSHYYCDDCWRGYIRAAVDDGPRCLSLRCPDPACLAAVVRELVDDVAAGGDRERYARFAFRSYVEENGGRIKWCPGPGCTRAVEFIGDADVVREVFCDCKHGFCWDCGEEAHRPVSCSTVRAWLAKNKSDSETVNWVLANTKHCPRCQRPIEKNQGCNHMTCPPPCNYHFCWLCLKPAATPDHYACDAMDRPPWLELDAGGKEEHMQRQAKASLDRYLYHYERWAANAASLEMAFRDMAVLERSELEKMAKAVNVTVTGLRFMIEAYHQIARGRRVLRWAHAYGYFLDPERDTAKRVLFDDLQNQANRWLEFLHGCTELERKELFGADSGTAIAAETFKAYRNKVANLTEVTRRFLENLVRAFETDLPEVVKPAD